jgi:hypothetical protein
MHSDTEPSQYRNGTIEFSATAKFRQDQVLDQGFVGVGRKVVLIASS